MRFHVDYSINGKAKSCVYDAENPGTAFAKCLSDNPIAVLTKAWLHGGVNGFEGHCEFDPPPVQREPVKDPRPCRAPKSSETEAGVDAVLR